MGYFTPERELASGTGGNDMAENKHKHGEMDIREQEKTFAGFMRVSVNVGIVCICIVIFLAIFAR
jgi:hypothetical protein